MPEPNMKAFDESDFKGEKYVKELVQECVGGAALQQCKSKIQSYSDQTSSALKKHVYANYMQFIETAKEISHLESEMYQLSHLLIEQRNILSTLREQYSVDDAKCILLDEPTNDADKDEIQNKRALAAIQESLIGFTGNLENKIFLHEGALIELDADSYRPICRVYFFLLNDLLIVGKVKHDKKLEYAAQYDATKIAVINIKDLDGVKNAINVITPDDSKIFQCISVTTKNEWIDRFETALKFNQLKKKKAPMPKPPSHFARPTVLPKSTTKTSLLNEAVSPTSTVSESQVVNVRYAPEWVLSAQEEIHTLIAQRHFEDALTLITKCEEYYVKDNSFHNASGNMQKMKQLKNDLSNVLLDELSNCQTRSLYSALVSSRVKLKLLADMNKDREACGTMLKVCTAAIRSSQRQARRNNLEISQLFFCDLAQVASEFLKAFKNNGACMSTLVVWCNYELQYFAVQLIKHYLTKGSQLEAVAKCVDGVREPCAKLSEIGLDLLYHLEGLLTNTLKEILKESRERLVDTINRTEKVWQPYNLQTKSNLRNVLRDLDALSIDMKSQVTGDTWINLTQSTVNFCRYYLSICESCAVLAKMEAMRPFTQDLLRELFKAQYNSKPSSSVAVDLNFVSKNNTYLVDTLLPVTISKYQKISGSKCEQLTGLLNELRGPPKPLPRSIYKTDVL